MFYFSNANCYGVYLSNPELNSDKEIYGWSDNITLSIYYDFSGSLECVSNVKIELIGTNEMVYLSDNYTQTFDEPSADDVEYEITLSIGKDLNLTFDADKIELNATLFVYSQDLDYDGIHTSSSCYFTIIRDTRLKLENVHFEFESTLVGHVQFIDSRNNTRLDFNDLEFKTKFGDNWHSLAMDNFDSNKTGYDFNISYESLSQLDNFAASMEFDLKVAYNGSEIYIENDFEYIGIINPRPLNLELSLEFYSWGEYVLFDLAAFDSLTKNQVDVLNTANVTLSLYNETHDDWTMLDPDYLPQNDILQIKLPWDFYIDGQNEYEFLTRVDSIGSYIISESNIYELDLEEPTSLVISDFQVEEHQSINFKLNLFNATDNTPIEDNLAHRFELQIRTLSSWVDVYAYFQRTDDFTYSCRVQWRNILPLLQYKNIFEFSLRVHFRGHDEYLFSNSEPRLVEYSHPIEIHEISQNVTFSSGIELKTLIYDVYLDEHIGLKQGLTVHYYFQEEWTYCASTSLVYNATEKSYTFEREKTIFSLYSFLEQQYTLPVQIRVNNPQYLLPSSSNLTLYLKHDYNAEFSVVGGQTHEFIEIKFHASPEINNHTISRELNLHYTIGNVSRDGNFQKVEFEEGTTFKVPWNALTAVYPMFTPGDSFLLSVKLESSNQSFSETYQVLSIETPENFGENLFVEALPYFGWTFGSVVGVAGLAYLGVAFHRKNKKEIEISDLSGFF